MGSSSAALAEVPAGRPCLVPKSVPRRRKCCAAGFSGWGTKPATRKGPTLSSGLLTRSVTGAPSQGQGEGQTGAPSQGQGEGQGDRIMKHLLSIALALVATAT